MKQTLFTIFVPVILTIFTSFASANETEPGEVNFQIKCTGDGEIDGFLWGRKKDPTIFYFNKVERRNPNYEENKDTEVYAIYGHLVNLDGDEYMHLPSVSSCKKINKEEIECLGAGLGNGPELKILINLKKGTGLGTYFNPWMRRGINVPNSANTYIYTDLKCHKVTK